MKPKFSIGDKVVKFAGGEWFGMEEGDQSVVKGIKPTSSNWHLIEVEGYSGLYADFNFRLVK